MLGIPIGILNKIKLMTAEDAEEVKVERIKKENKGRNEDGREKIEKKKKERWKMRDGRMEWIAVGGEDAGCKRYGMEEKEVLWLD